MRFWFNKNWLSWMEVSFAFAINGLLVCSIWHNIQCKKKPYTFSNSSPWHKWTNYGHVNKVCTLLILLMFTVHIVLCVLLVKLCINTCITYKVIKIVMIGSGSIKKLYNAFFHCILPVASHLAYSPLSNESVELNSKRKYKVGCIYCLMQYSRSHCL